MTMRNAFENLATEPTVEAIKELNDTMLALLSAILEKMPRVTGNDQAAISIEGGSVGISANQDLRNITGSVASISQFGGKHITNGADALTMSGTNHIYSNIIVS